MNRLLLAATVALVLAAGATHAAPPLPKAIETPAPVFPQGEKASPDATVTIQFKIDDGGRVDYANVAKSSGSDALDAAAMEAVMAYRFEAPAPSSTANRPLYTKVVAFNTSGAAAQAPQPDAHYAGAPDTEARLVRTVPLEYPIEARKKNQQGDVLLELKIGAGGSMDGARVIQTSGFPVLDDAAIATAQRYEYSPAAVKGKPVASLKTLRITFKLQQDERELKQLELATAYSLCGDRLKNSATKKDIEQLIEFSGVRKQVQDLIDYSSQQFDSIIAEQMEPSLKAAPAAQRERMQAIAADFRAKAFTLLSWEKMEPIYEKAYCDTFSEQEVKSINAFYHSPAGQALTRKNPNLLANVNLQQQPMNDMMEQYVAEMLEAAKTAMGRTEK
jgi:TonB family protein